MFFRYSIAILLMLSLSRQELAHCKMQVTTAQSLISGKNPSRMDEENRTVRRK